MRAQLAVALILLASTRVPAQTTPVTVQLLAINDLHGNLDPPSGAYGQVGGVPAGGVEYLATHLRLATHDNPNTLVIGAGDNFGGSPALSALFQEVPTIRSLNAMHLDVTSIGNHELDHGPDELLSKIHGACPTAQPCPESEQTRVHFQYLAGNVERRSKPGEALFPATAIRTVGGVKVGFIGVTLLATDAMIAAKSGKDLRFLEESAVANTAAASLESQGIHTIVLLIHQGVRQYPASGHVNPNGCDTIRGDLLPLLPRLAPSIHIVVSGHSHFPYNCQIAGRTVTSADAYGRMFTRFTLTIDPATDTLLYFSAHNEIVTRDVPKDPTQTAILDLYRPQADRIINRVVGSVTAALPHKMNPAGESLIGDVVADAYLASTSDPAKGGAVLAFVNNEGIRGELSAPSPPSTTRPVTYGDLYAATPFGNRVTVVTLTGDQLRQVLEQQFLASGGMDPLEPSAGFAYQFRLKAPAGQHVVPGSMTLNGRPIAPSDSLRIAVNDFLAGGSGGFFGFLKGTNLIDGPIDIDAVVDYVTTHSPVAPATAARITRVD